MKTLFLIHIIILVLPACKKISLDELDLYLRKNHSKHLITPPPPNFNKVLGYKPSKIELELGRLLFNDVILSRNNDVSCATCHLSNHGFATGNRLDFGALGKGGPHGDNVGSKWASGTLSTSRHCGNDSFGFNCQSPMFRNALSTINVAYRSDPINDSGLLWDGRFGKLSFQTLLPIHTKEEMCGTNPLPNKKLNVFSPLGPLFKTPIKVRHSHAGNRYSGLQFDAFNSAPELIEGVSSYRKNKTRTIPLRNECTAIAVAKIRSIKKYTSLFHKVYNEPVNDLNIGKALAAFVTSHVAINTPFDKYVLGKTNALTKNQKIGAAIFFSDSSNSFIIDGQKYIGASCVKCHSSTLFGGVKFASLAVKSDPLSSLSKPSLVFDLGQSGFFPNIHKQRGKYPRCHIKDITTTNTYAPDMGRALATYSIEDCFKFRVPSLRNVIETAPYMHHGSFFAQGTLLTSYKEQSFNALKQAISYHIVGIKNWKKEESFFAEYKYNDPFFNLDKLIPIDRIDLISKITQPLTKDISMSIHALTDFVAYGLWDKTATKIGYWKNDVTHPKSVPSGFKPTITRDHGNQSELPPNAKPFKLE